MVSRVTLNTYAFAVDGTLQVVEDGIEMVRTVPALRSGGPKAPVREPAYAALVSTSRQGVNGTKRRPTAGDWSANTYAAPALLALFSCDAEVNRDSHSRGTLGVLRGRAQGVWSACLMRIPSSMDLSRSIDF
jgi:hypothetical protein